MEKGKVLYALFCVSFWGGLAISVIGVVVMLAISINEETPTSAPVITTTAPETTPEITTVEIDGITYAIMDNKLYEIVKE